MDQSVQLHLWCIHTALARLYVKSMDDSKSLQRFQCVGCVKFLRLSFVFSAKAPNTSNSEVRLAELSMLLMLLRQGANQSEHHTVVTSHNVNVV